MGNGLKYKCKHCNQEFDVYRGMGFSCEMNLYICPKCKGWKNITVKDFLVEKDFAPSIKNDFFCEKCQISMKPYTKDSHPNICCNECGMKLDLQHLFCWD